MHASKERRDGADSLLKRVDRASVKKRWGRNFDRKGDALAMTKESRPRNVMVRGRESKKEEEKTFSITVLKSNKMVAAKIEKS